MDQLGVVDSSFLYLEDGTTHLHIGSCAVFEGPAMERDEFLALMAAKLDHIPRYRQRIRLFPLQLDRPIWVDDARFDLSEHVHRAALPAPGGRAELGEFMSRVMSIELERDKPLWETWLVEGLQGGRWAMVSKVHHCLVDGVSGTDLLAAVLDADPAVTRWEPPGRWTPAPEPRAVRLTVAAWRDGLAVPLHGVALAARTLRRPRAVLRHAFGTASGLATYASSLRHRATHSLAGSIGGARHWTWASVPLEDLKEIRKAFGGTVNDVAVSAVTAGLRALLLSRGEQADGAVVRALIPVSTRTDDERGTYNNRVSALFADLPVGEADAVGRLAAVRAEIARRKASHEVEAGRSLEALGHLPVFPVLAAVEWLAMRLLRDHPQRRMTTVVTNVPGPQFPLYLAGRRMVEYLPFVPIAHGARVGTAVVSYDGKVAFGVTADYTSVPDIETVAAAIGDEIRLLLARAGTGKRTRPQRATAGRVPSASAARRRAG